MSYRRFASSRVLIGALALLVVALWIAPGIVIGQQASTTGSGYQPPRTSDGRPDLEGYWTSLTYTPLERPAELANKPLYTEAEAQAEFDKAVAAWDDQIVHYAHPDFGDTPHQSGAMPNLRTSLVIDPPDGRIPALTPEAQKRVAARREAAKNRVPGIRTASDLGPFNTCIFYPGAIPITPPTYAGGVHIVQSPGWVMITTERMSERRIIPLDGRAQAPQAMRSRAGYGRGRWDGDTLVIETTNFSAKRSFRESEGTFKVVERFRRIGPDTVDYQFTVEDPTTWVRPWTAEVPLNRLANPHKTSRPILEYSCNENNQDAYATIRNARLQEQGRIAPPDETRVGDPRAVIRALTSDSD